MWTHEAAIRIRIAVDQLVAVNAETLDDLPIDRGRLRETIASLREMAVALEARRPNPGLYTNFMLDAVQAAGFVRSDGDVRCKPDVHAYTANRFLAEMGRDEMPFDDPES